MTGQPLRDFSLKDNGADIPPNPYGFAFRAHLEVVTPMFLAGADQQTIKHEGLRSPSVKSALRWWWRAVSPIAEHAALKAEEGKLFGDTDSGQGLRVTTSTASNWAVISPDADGSLGYLLGQGLYRHGRGVTRPAIASGSQATLQISARSVDQHIDQAIEAIFLFGGLGARSRRGFGSLAYADPDQQPSDLTAYRDRIESLLRRLPERSGVPSWSHLSPDSRWILLNRDFPSWKHALDALGTPLLQFRQSLGGQSAPYGEDHDLVSDHLHKNHQLRSAPRRSAFGIPHNYYFKSSKKKLDFHWNANDRRASPLLLHVTRLANGRYASLAVLMDGPFLPPGSHLVTKQTKARVDPPDYSAIHDYLDTLEKA